MTTNAKQDLVTYLWGCDIRDYPEGPFRYTVLDYEVPYVVHTSDLGAFMQWLPSENLLGTTAFRPGGRGRAMTRIAAFDISLSLNRAAAACICDLKLERICAQCECLRALADAVLAYDNRCLMQRNREARGVVD